jgi:glycoside/pentoside/hexuronide:cation symporter, GPH family
MKKNPWLFSMGNIGSSITARTFGSYIVFFYVDKLKLDAMLIGTGMLIFGIWNAINDPLLGHISDRTRSSKGRRTPYILYGIVPLAVTFALLWIPGQNWFGGNTTALFAYFMIIIFIYDTLYTMVFLNWSALYAEMFQEEQQRTKVSASNQIMGIVGNIIGVAIPPLLYDSIGWSAMGISFAVIGLAAMVLGTKSFDEDKKYQEAGSLKLWEAISATFRNYSFVTFVLASTFIQFTFSMLQGTLPFYAKYVLHIGNGETSAVMGAIFISAACTVFIWTAVTRRLGARNTIMLSTIVYGVFLIPFWVANSFLTGLITAILLGTGLSGLMILLDVLLSDAIDEDELHTGVRREGMYFGANALVVRLGGSLQVIIMGFVFDRTKYDANLAVQPDSAVIGMKILISAIPIAALLAALVFLYLYPLHGERLREMKNKLGSNRISV